MATATRKVDARKSASKRLGLLARLAKGPVICAEGYVFELERRGYLQAGAYVPEVVLEQPAAVEALHREFVNAGSDVVEALTYYAHRAKMKIIGRQGDVPSLNRRALAIARRVARATGTLLAGNICNTHIYDPQDPKSIKAIRGMFDEQVGWALEAGADFIIGETYGFAGEAILATEAIKRTGLPAVVTLAVYQDGLMRDGRSVVDACKRLEDAGADVVGMNCTRGPTTMLPLLKNIRKAVTCHVAALPVPYRTTPAQPTFQSLRDPGCDCLPGDRPFPTALDPVPLQSLRDRRVRQGGVCHGYPLSRRVLRRRSASHPRARRGAGSHAAGEPLFAGHVEARLPGVEQATQDAQYRLPQQVVDAAVDAARIS